MKDICNTCKKIINYNVMSSYQMDDLQAGNTEDEIK